MGYTLYVRLWYGVSMEYLHFFLDEKVTNPDSYRGKGFIANARAGFHRLSREPAQSPIAIGPLCFCRAKNVRCTFSLRSALRRGKTNLKELFGPCRVSAKFVISSKNVLSLRD